MGNHRLFLFQTKRQPSSSSKHMFHHNPHIVKTHAFIIVMRPTIFFVASYYVRSSSLQLQFLLISSQASDESWTEFSLKDI